MKLRFALLSLFAAVCALPTVAQSALAYKWEMGVGYNFVHSNAPPSGCGCFSMNGGSASIERRFTPAVSVVGEFHGTTSGNVAASGHALTLTDYLAGPRYRYAPKYGHTSLFGEVLVGGAHASGAMYAASGAVSGSANAFAAAMGGGVEVNLSPRIEWRLVEADYLLTLLPNGVNDRQNNVSLSTGVTFRFGER